MPILSGVRLHCCGRVDTGILAIQCTTSPEVSEWVVVRAAAKFRSKPPTDGQSASYQSDRAWISLSSIADGSAWVIH